MTNDQAFLSNKLNGESNSQHQIHDLSSTPSYSNSHSKPWELLIVDDDHEVHETTTLALKRSKIFGKPLKFHHCYSSTEAMTFLDKNKEISVALIDVVMEHKTSGLNLVEDIRRKGNNEIRLILRTGQPELAPEHEVAEKFDINDYKSKSEMTRAKLIMSITTAIRSYSHIHHINQNRNTVEKILEATSRLIQEEDSHVFLDCVSEQLKLILGKNCNGIIATTDFADRRLPSINDFQVQSSFGLLKGVEGLSLAEITIPSMMSLFARTIGSVDLQIEAYSLAMAFSNGRGCNLFICVTDFDNLPNDRLAILKIFLNNIGICFENINTISELRQLAFIDPIMEMPNQNSFEKTLKREVALDKDTLKIVVLHIDRLRPLITTFGSKVIGNCLKKIFFSLVKNIPGLVTIAKLNSGEVGILIDDKEFDSSIINHTFSNLHKINGVNVALSATTIVMDIVNQHEDVSTIVENAISAVHKNLKVNRGKVTFITPSEQYSIKHGLYIHTLFLHDLNRQLRDKIKASFQPEIDLQTGHIIGAEALARWSLNNKPISPKVFIPMSESKHISTNMTYYMLDIVTDWIKKRTKDEKKLFPVSINLSLNDLLCTPKSAENIIALLEYKNVQSSLIKFEISELDILNELQSNLSSLYKLSEAGFKLIIDDFGTGYSSLEFLKKFPVNVIKIGRKYVDQLGLGSPSSSLVAASLAIAKTLNLGTIAKGVESLDQVEALKELQCDAAQGHFYSKPVTMENFDTHCSSYLYY